MIISVVGLGIALVLLGDLRGSHGDQPDSRIGHVTDSTVTDVDGNVYRVVTIGTQVWIVENLKVTHYRDGSSIPYVSDDTAWSNLSSGAYCWYDDDSAAYKDTYGALYNFYAVTDSCGLCPDGWHVPTKSEWLVLEVFLGGRDVAGGSLKDTGTVHWKTPNLGATNASGFTGLPGGGRGQISGCGEIGNYATWWTSTPDDSLFAWHWGLCHGYARIRSNPGHMASGFSVRCVRD